MSDDRFSNRGFGGDRRDQGGSRSGYGNRRGGYGGRGGHGGRHNGRDDRQQDRRGGRPKVPIPDEPPFEIYCGNLPQDCVEGDFHDYIFKDSTIKSIRMVRDRDTDKFKGTAFIEFEDRDSLVASLELDGAFIEGRSIRVNVSEGKGKGGRGRGRGRGRGGGQDSRGGHDGGRGGRRYQDNDRGDRGPPGPRAGAGGDRFADRRPPQEEFKLPDAESASRRPRLNLKPRTVDAPVGQASNADSSVFGGAKPKDAKAPIEAKDETKEVTEKMEKL
eukprot:TRINITY_DN12560_c0_g2_i1.p1 TRINITY_DN12560_c0_g2~~TRINITY_DN12560_c0_g2_i1.p1  ORF type:complete len:274 (+),score=32.98 TRINITY_DN12560_c0_g2_i1:64-885(+)